MTFMGISKTSKKFPIVEYYMLEGCISLSRRKNSNQRKIRCVLRHDQNLSGCSVIEQNSSVSLFSSHL